MSTLEQVKSSPVRSADGGIRGWLENTRNFFTEVRNETRRVTWPSRREVYATTLVVITFLCGLIPVLGNLISNTVITILSLGVSVGTAAASLTFLVVIHKLEYLINSRIVGGETDSQAWEILLAILLFVVACLVGPGGYSIFRGRRTA